MIDTTKFTFFVIVVLALGLGAGYYYGNIKGLEVGLKQGREAVMAEQRASEEAAFKEIQDMANPFSEDTGSAANPFKDVYTNPFAQ